MGANSSQIETSQQSENEQDVQSHQTIKSSAPSSDDTQKAQATVSRKRMRIDVSDDSEDAEATHKKRKKRRVGNRMMRRTRSLPKGASGTETVLNRTDKIFHIPSEQNVMEISPDRNLNDGKDDFDQNEVARHDSGEGYARSGPESPVKMSFKQAHEHEQFLKPLSGKRRRIKTYSKRRFSKVVGESPSFAEVLHTQADPGSSSEAGSPPRPDASQSRETELDQEDETMRMKQSKMSSDRLAESDLSKEEVEVSASASGRKRHPTIDATIIKPPAVFSNGPSIGPWTPEEKEIVNMVVEEVCIVMQIEKAQLFEQISAWRDLATFKECLRQALPMRNWTSVRKFCRRQYRRGKRGQWTNEEDQVLRRELAQRGPKWAEISAIVDRAPDDCRDRYTKILQYGSDREQGTWSHKEKLQLYRIVEQCIDLLKQRDDLEIGPHDLDQMVNWDVVAEKFGRRRSAKRCREKWQFLKAHDFKQQLIDEEEDADMMKVYLRNGT